MNCQLLKLRYLYRMGMMSLLSNALGLSCSGHMLTTPGTSMLSIPWLNIRRITIRTAIQEAGYNIWIFHQTFTMKYYGDFNQGFTSQAMTSIDRSNWCSVWRIPNICGISTGMTFILGSSTQFDPPKL